MTLTSTTKRTEKADAPPLLIHPIGGGDLGWPPLATSPAPIDFHGGPDDRRPLRKVFDGLTETGTEISGLLLIGTTNVHGPSQRPFVEHAQAMKELLSSEEGLCGRTFPKDDVHIAQVSEPTVRHSVKAMKPELTALAPGECLLTSGAGSYALGAGVLLAGIETGVPMTLLPVDEPSAAYRLRDLIDPHDTLRNWLLRHRFWDELAAVDPPNADLWRLLAARQRADISLAEATAPSPRFNQGRLTKFAELWPTVQAAFYERLARGEAIDNSLLRAWFTQRISKPSKKEAATVSASAERVLDDLARKLSDPEQRGGAALIKDARRRLSPVPQARHAALVGDAEFIDFFEKSASHEAHLVPPGARRLPGSLLANADQWEQGDLVPALVEQCGLTAWPVLGTGDVLVLMCVGMVTKDDPNDKEGHAAVRQVIDWASRRRSALARPGRIRLRLLASGETMERAGSWVTLAKSTAPAGSLDAAVLGPFSTEPGDAADINAALLAELAKAEPTGLYGSTSLRDVDEVLLVINSGKPVTVNGMVAAGVQWSLNAACPLRVAELGRDRALRTVINEAGLTLCRLGMDARLARLASSAVRRLDTRTAWQLLANGSPALTDARDAAARLHRDLYGHANATTSMDARCKAACRRLELIAHVLADEPWPACYTAVEVLRPGLFGWAEWTALRQRFAPLRKLNAYRNETPYAHLLDRLREGRAGQAAKARKRPPASQVILEELRGCVGAFQELRSPRSRQSEPDRELVTRHTRLCEQLEKLGEDAR
ncbi:hypothetical protein [Actinomadura decatromicini]|uniref:Uncharacterized protein n=1 Tax=Actinomadura decatromicini TaxID=2604572 RepID=A0A5D3FUS3_9ACTN|nr:hypothetical protein [Actinomadura decatromicini]TYK52617.1 hypothetical protein FXF68_02265 [Actinomadura decatromicini]